MTSDLSARATPTAQFRKKTSVDWEADSRFHEYTAAVNPNLPPIAATSYGAQLHSSGPTCIIPFDLSQQLGTTYAATSPALLAAFLHVLPGETLSTQASATSQLFYVIRGSGKSTASFAAVDWEQGDLFVVPMNAELDHVATSDAALYWVTDEPLLSYLGVQPGVPRFRPTMFRRESLLKEVEKVRNQPGAEDRNRLGVLLGNRATPDTKTLTHTLWSLLNVLPAGAIQKPHRHNSVALDLCIDGGLGCYTLIGEELVASGEIRDPVRMDWAAGAAFVTPPGLWHSHHNATSQDAWVLPIQDAGLHTYLRTLDIRFASG